MSQEALYQVLRRLDLNEEAVFTFDDMREWPDGSVDRLVQFGILQEIKPAKEGECEGCEERCVEPVVKSKNYEGEVRGSIFCNECNDIGCVEFDLQRLRRWKVGIPVFAITLAGTMGLSEEPKEIIKERLWFIGKSSHGRKRMDFFFAVGYCWHDGSKIFPAKLFEQCSTPVILVPDKMPETISPNNLRFFSIRRLLELSNGAISFDMPELLSALVQNKSRKSTVVQNVVSLSGSSTLHWAEISIAFRNEHEVLIKWPGNQKIMEFEELGFVDRRKKRLKQPDKQWELLRDFGRNNGRIGWETSRRASNLDPAKIKSKVTNLRERLRVLFPNVAGNPIFYDELDKAYKTTFYVKYDDQGPNLVAGE